MVAKRNLIFLQDNLVKSLIENEAKYTAQILPVLNYFSIKKKQVSIYTLSSVIFLLGTITNETVMAQVGCTGKAIVEFITTSPIGLVKSAIINPSTGQKIYV